MEKDLKALLDKAVLSEETKDALSQAWTKKVEAVREEVSAELRKEFASRFDHDKATIIEAMDKFITDNLQKEIKTLVESQKALVKERVSLASKGKTISEKFEKFLNKKLTEEVSEFVANRKDYNERVVKAEKFIVNKLSEELKEFEDCKTKLIEERVALETDKATAINEAKKRFVEKASALAEKVITEAIRAEMTQLRTELVEARKSLFGRKLYDAFAAEYGANFFNESREVNKVSAKVNELQAQLAEATKTVGEKDTAIMEAKKEASIAKELVERNNILSEILSPLVKEKRGVMRKLLESVETGKLRTNFTKFLPTVMGYNTDTESKKTLTEKVVGTDESTSQEGKRVVDGNRKNFVSAYKEEENEAISEIVRLSARSF